MGGRCFLESVRPLWGPQTPTPRLTFERLEVLNGLAEHRDLVHLAAVAGRDHGGELIDEAVHFLPPPLLGQAVWLPADILAFDKGKKRIICIRLLM